LLPKTPKPLQNKFLSIILNKYKRMDKSKSLSDIISKERALKLHENEDHLRHLKNEFFLPEGYLYFSAH
jgi:hypothetical protein